MGTTKQPQYTVSLTILQKQLGFFGGLFVGQTLSDENTDEEKDIAIDNFNAIKNFMDTDQLHDISEAAKKLGDPATMKKLTDKGKKFIEAVKKMLDTE